MVTEASCIKCRTKREISYAKLVMFANGLHALQGACLNCQGLFFQKSLGRGFSRQLLSA